MGKVKKFKEQRKIAQAEDKKNKQKKGELVRNTLLATGLIGLVLLGWFWLSSSEPTTSMDLAANDSAASLNKKIAVIETNLGQIKLELFEDQAPQTVANFEKLALAGFYDGLKFHRVIDDFMIQAGCPYTKTAEVTKYGTGGPGYYFDDEINDRKLVRGSLAMANAGTNTNGSQFFIVTKEATPWLDGRHTNFGQVLEGMAVVDQIEKVETGENDLPLEAVIIEKVYIISE